MQSPTQPTQPPGMTPQQAMSAGSSMASGFNQMGFTPQQAFGAAQAIAPIIPSRPTTVN